jgi:hypothetical protein
MKYKLTLLYTFFCILLFLGIIHWSTYLIINKICKKSSSTKIKEGLTEFEKYSYRLNPYPKDAVINYNDLNSPLYSHTVNLPINDPISCKNFCGPKAQCAITREQCSADIDCYGCNPGPTTLDSCENKDISPYDNGGKLGQNQGLQYSPLTTGYDNHGIDFEEVYPGSKYAEIKKPYQGVDLWTKSFNEGLKLYNKKRLSAEQYSEGISDNIHDTPKGKMPYYEQKYPMTISATGQFYETLPPASNSYLS